jgi:hypothetical protein
MKGTWKRIWQVTLVLLATAAVGAADSTNMPPPGTLNYVEGQVLVQGQKQSPKSVGSTYLEPNQVLNTRDGNAEMLLTPGVYLRIGHHSAVRMISPDLADTRVQLKKGSAMLEVDELFKENNVNVLLDSTTTRVLKKGLYDFNTNPASVKVLDGKAVTYEGDQRVKLKKGREALLAEGQPLVRRKFNKHVVEADPLYRWSKLRSEYATEANVDTSYALMTNGGWWGPGWYWDPFWYDFAFLPGNGMLWGPFGWPFFAPGYIAWAPYYGFHWNGDADYYHYPAPASNGARRFPPLAHAPVRGSAGFRALRGNMARNVPMRMGGSRSPLMRGGALGRGFGGFHDGGFGGSFHRGDLGGDFHGGGFHGGFGHGR